MDKKQLRKEIISYRSSLDKTFLDEKAKIITNTLLQLPEVTNANTIGIYRNIDHEVNTHLLIATFLQNKKVAIPKCINNEMEFYLHRHINDYKVGYFHTQEPICNQKIDKEDIDLLIIPLLYFDTNKNRIGYGKGFYDRYLKDYKGLKIGIAYDFQKIENTYPHEFDIPLDMIITENNIYH